MTPDPWSVIDRSDAVLRQMRRDEEREARACSLCGDPLADPDTGRAIVVEQDGATTSAYHEDCGEPFESFTRLDSCGHCGRLIWFHGRGTRCRTYCAPSCRKRRAYAVTEQVQPLTRTCPGCGQWFTPKRDDQRTCSPRCRQRVHRHGDQHPVTYAQHALGEPPTFEQIADLVVDLDLDDITEIT